jgi:hypothetical protein
VSYIFLKIHHNTKFSTLNYITVSHISESRASAGIVDQNELEITNACNGVKLVPKFLETSKLFRKAILCWI